MSASRSSKPPSDTSEDCYLRMPCPRNQFSSNVQMTSVLLFSLYLILRLGYLHSPSTHAGMYNECINIKHPSLSKVLSNSGSTGASWGVGSKAGWLAEIASCQMEYKYLAHLTGRKEYYDVVRFHGNSKSAHSGFLTCELYSRLMVSICICIMPTPLGYVDFYQHSGI